MHEALLPALDDVEKNKRTINAKQISLNLVWAIFDSAIFDSAIFGCAIFIEPHERSWPKDFFWSRRHGSTGVLLLAPIYLSALAAFQHADKWTQAIGLGTRPTVTCRERMVGLRDERRAMLDRGQPSAWGVICSGIAHFARRIRVRHIWHFGRHGRLPLTLRRSGRVQVADGNG